MSSGQYDPVPITIYDSSTSKILEESGGMATETAAYGSENKNNNHCDDGNINDSSMNGGMIHGSNNNTKQRNVNTNYSDNYNNNNKPETVAKEYMRKWLDSFRYEQNNSTSIVLYLQKKLHEALKSSKHLGNPNEFRTAVCCHLLDIICRTFGRYSELVDKLKMEIYASIYMDKDGLFERLQNLNGVPPTAEVFIEFQPYFRKVERMLKRKHDLEEEVAAAVRQRNKMKEELNKKQKVLNATAKKWQMTLIEQTFRTWAKTVSARQQQRAVLLQYFLNKDKARLKLVLKEWRLQIHRTKRERAKEDLDDASDKVSELEAERDKLEKERDVANDKIQNLKQELDVAQKELATLDDEAVKVQREIAESKEAELTAAARAWAELCDTACFHQMKALRKKLDTLDEDPYYADITLLANAPSVVDEHGKIKRIATLPPHPTEDEIEVMDKNKVDWKNDQEATVLHLPVDLLLLRWINFHLLNAKYKKIVENFTTDVHDSEEIAIVLAACSRSLSSPVVQTPLKAKLRNFDIEARAEEIVHRIAKLGGPPLIDVDDIVLMVPDTILAMFSYFFCNYPQLRPNPLPWVVASDALNRAMTAWTNLKKQWLDGSTIKSTSGDTLKTMNSIDETTVRKVGKQVMAACTAAKHAIQRHARASKLYERVRVRVRNYAWDALNARAKGKPVTILDRRLIRERKAFTELRIDLSSKKGQRDGSLAKRFNLEANPMKEKKEITEILTQNFEDLKRIYKHYCSSKPGAGGTMDLAEFGMMMYDIKLPPKIFPVSILEEIFRVTNKVSESSAKYDLELEASEYIEALIRVASRLFKKQSFAFNESNDQGKLLTISELFRIFLDDKLLPYACRSDAHRFREELKDDAVKAIFRKYRDQLQKLFKNYARGDGSMDTNEFLKFVRDRQLINNSFSLDEFYNVFNKVQDDEGAFHAAVGSLGLDEHGHDEGIQGFKLSTKLRKLDQELNYSEFLEGLATIAIYKDPDPYVPLKQKIETFLSQDIL
jgi:hypothetical protein